MATPMPSARLVSCVTSLHERSGQLDQTRVRELGFELIIQFGKAEDQAQEGCEQIAGVPELAGGVSLHSQRLILAEWSGGRCRAIGLKSGKSVADS